VKVGVRPWQGYDRAVQHTLAYVGRYLLAGLIPAILFSIAISAIGESPGAPILIHLGSVPILFPGAFIVNFAGLRWDSSRSWRRHPRRAWQAALLSLIMVWSGLLICAESPVTPPRILEHLISREGAWVLFHCSLAVLLSDLALVFVWLSPPDRREDR
jgi:hypothetical protein